MSDTHAALSEPRSLDELFSLYELHGDRRYGEDVTGLEHALQCAALARADGASDELIVAALFHDVGWFLTEDLGGDATPAGDHAAAGARILSPLFGAGVAQPVALHVMAKRWRCTVDPDYFDELSPTSQATFITQGGPLSTAERARFEAHPGFASAMALRAWDDRATLTELAVAGLDDYRALAETLAEAQRRRRDAD